MIPAGACSGAPAAATATSASGERQDNASEAGEAGFSGLLSGSGETSVVASAPAPAARGDTRGAAPADRHESEGSQEPGVPDELPEHLLSLLDGTWPPPAASAPRLSGSLPPDSLSMPGAGRVLPLPPPTLAGAHATAPGLATGSAVIGVEGTLPLMRSVPDAAVAAATATATASTSPGAVQGSTQAVPTAADFAKAIGLMNAGAGGAGVDPIREPSTESGERNPLQSITSGMTPVPVRVAAPAASSTPALALPADPGAGFDDAFGARIGWLADQRIGRAEIRVTPEHLGAIDVRLQIDGNRISAEFSSTHADVRHTLEASVGRLRDLLGQQGLQLAHADVGHGDGGDRSGNRDGSAARGGDDAGSDADAIDLSTATMVRARGLLDEYA